MKLVDTLEEQAMLEAVLEPTKPPIPDECQQLDFLLFTPFRYGAPYPHGSRFRRAGVTPGVFYASDTIETAVTEMVFHRLLFFADAPTIPWPLNAGEYTVFSVGYRSDAALDLTRPRLLRDRPLWTHPTNYEACQTLAERARAADVAIIRYASVRAQSDSTARNVALLACRAFSGRSPTSRQTWRFFFANQGVRAICDRPQRRLEFGRTAFANDARMASFPWDRSHPA
jgi:hypothetical protein